LGRLTTHVLDTANGRPAAGVRIELYSIDGAAAALLASAQTNADGRTDRPLLEGDALKAGVYQLEFHAGEYFRATGATDAAPPFVGVVPVRFGIADPAVHYHVPLLCTPWSYSTYRGS
jgi:5-hydroxyisourate hydrolase